MQICDKCVNSELFVSDSIIIYTLIIEEDTYCATQQLRRKAGAKEAAIRFD